MAKRSKKTPYSDLASAFQQLVNLSTSKKKDDAKHKEIDIFLNNAMQRELLSSLVSKLKVDKDLEVKLTLPTDECKVAIFESFRLRLLGQDIDDKLGFDSDAEGRESRENSCKWLGVGASSVLVVTALTILVSQIGVGALVFTPALISALCVAIAVASIVVIAASLFAASVLPRKRYSAQVDSLVRSGGELVFNPLEKKPLSEDPVVLLRHSKEIEEETEKKLDCPDDSYSDDGSW